MSIHVKVSVEGMTCNHCVSAVSSEVSALPGVDAVQVELVRDGLSSVTITTAEPLGEDQLAAAIERAGYQMVPGISSS
jgi:copper chaperone CopZ